MPATRGSPTSRTSRSSRTYQGVPPGADDAGLPYGTLPRLLLAWVSTEAVRTQSPELILGDSLAESSIRLGEEFFNEVIAHPVPIDVNTLRAEAAQMRGASTTEVMLAGNWKTARMVAHYSAGATAERGAVARYL